MGLGLVGGAAPGHLRAAGEENFPPLGPLVAVRWPQDGPAAPLCDGPKRAPSRGDHNGERAVAWRCVWPGALPTFCALAAWRSAEAHGGALMCPRNWGALQQRTVECSFLAPWLLGAL